MEPTHTFDNLYVLILAGGKGRRLWPESLVEMPKQFIDFFGTGQTQLQDTYARYRQFLPATHILISTHVSYTDIVHQQLPEVDDENILAEPIWRNTGASTAWGAYRIAHLNPAAVVLVAPSDHHVINQQAFVADIATGTAFVSHHDRLLTLGVTPTRPEPGYGYIQFEQALGDGIYTTRSFTEKPNREFAQLFMESGEFFWNTGMLLSSARYLLACMQKSIPSIFEPLQTASMHSTIAQENAYVLEHFPRYPNISLEEGVIEKTPAVCVMKCSFGWADLGTWHGIYEAERKTNDDNVVLDSDVVLDNAHNNIIKIPHGHHAVINGLNGYIVVEKGDTLLICPKEDSSALIRKYSAEAELR